MSNFLLTLICALTVLALAVIAMGVKALFVKGGKFPNTHVCNHNFEKNEKETRKS